MQKLRRSIATKPEEHQHCEYAYLSPFAFFTSPIMSEHVFCFLIPDEVLKSLISISTISLCIKNINSNFTVSVAFCQSWLIFHDVQIDLYRCESLSHAILLVSKLW